MNTTWPVWERVLEFRNSGALISPKTYCTGGVKAVLFQCQLPSRQKKKVFKLLLINLPLFKSKTRPAGSTLV